MKQKGVANTNVTTGEHVSIDPGGDSHTNRGGAGPTKGEGQGGLQVPPPLILEILKSY